MIDLRLITDEEIAFFINAQMTDDSFKQDSLSRSGLVGFIESIKETNPKNMTSDSYYRITNHLTWLRKFKEGQEAQLDLFKNILKNY